MIHAPPATIIVTMIIYQNTLEWNIFPKENYQKAVVKSLSIDTQFKEKTPYVKIVANIVHNKYGICK